VVLAGSEIELAKAITSRSFDLVLMDPGLPGVNGLEFCSLMKGNRILRKIPVIFMSREPGKEQVRKAFEAGCDEYVEKPLRLSHLLKIIKYFLENY
jgi:CheY-like chemotaxis protein